LRGLGYGFCRSFNYLKSLIPEGKTCILNLIYLCNDFSKFFLTNDNDWYLNACPISFMDYPYAQSFCGARESDDFGHCWVIFTKKPVNSSEDISKAILSSAIIEPQNGAYEFSYTQGLMEGYEFYVIITGNDLFMKLNGLWKGYSDYYNELIGKKEDAKSIVAEFGN
jgi:hypothetical protein